MQGTIFAGLKCTKQLDCLAQKAYDEGSPLYLYKNTVRIPPMEMVDDLAVITKCGNDTIKANAVINSFIESKKLNFSKKKCHQMHIGENRITCPEVNVHEDKMIKSKEEKYLGDIITDDGNNNVNIKNRQSKGYGIVAEIASIVNEIPFGNHQFEVAIKLREAMLINGMLTNTEVTHGLTDKIIEDLERVDEFFIRQILKAHSKTPIESLYLETGVIPIKHVIKNRRLSYLKHILSRNDHELISKVYKAQKRKPAKHDWFLTITNDKTKIGLTYTYIYP